VFWHSAVYTCDPTSFQAIVLTITTCACALLLYHMFVMLAAQQHEQHKRRHNAAFRILAVWKHCKYCKLKLLSRAFFRSSLALHIVLRARIHRKCIAATTLHKFLRDCSSARGPVSCVKRYIAGVVKCQRIIRSWLVCRAARIEVSTLYTQYLHFLEVMNCGHYCTISYE
jgi:hypothetical protein